MRRLVIPLLAAVLAACGGSSSVQASPPVTVVGVVEDSPQPTVGLQPQSTTVVVVEREPTPVSAPSQGEEQVARAAPPVQLRPAIGSPTLLTLSGEECSFTMDVYDHLRDDSVVNRATGQPEFNPDDGVAANWVDSHLEDGHYVNPGEPGYALIGAHVYDEFGCLDRLQAGEQLVVEDDLGNAMTFVSVLDPVDLHKEQIEWDELRGDHIGESVLNLITCGDRNSESFAEGQYRGHSTRNVIVTFALVSIDGRDPYGDPLPTYYVT